MTIAPAPHRPSEQLNAPNLSRYEFVGELALTGAPRGVPSNRPARRGSVKGWKYQIVVAVENSSVRRFHLKRSGAC